jgi:hypothetical protein
MFVTGLIMWWNRVIAPRLRRRSPARAAVPVAGGAGMQPDC